MNTEGCMYTKKSILKATNTTGETDLDPDSNESVKLVSESGFVVFGYPDSRYPSRYRTICMYPDPDS